MREIKFRFWSGYKMLYEPSFDQIYVCLNQQRKFSSDSDRGYDHIGTHGAAFLQFTGLKDKNGKEIYEGDIVKWKSYKKKSDKNIVYNNVVEYQAFGTLTGYRLRNKSFHKPLTSNGIFNAEAEVIGNIYENPELLK